MENAEQVQAVGFNLLEGGQLLARVHAEANRAAGRVEDGDDAVDRARGTSEEAAGFIGQAGFNMRPHLVEVSRRQTQLS